MRFHPSVFMLCLAAGLAGCAVDPKPVDIRLSRHVARPPRSALIFFVDGLDETRLDEMLSRGELRNIEERFVRRGVRVRGAIASMPSLTYPNSVSLITGRFPGHHGILGNKWFDPRTLEMPDYIRAISYRDVNRHFSAPTIYEVLTDHLTVNIQGHTRRGVTHTYDHMVPTGVNFFLGMFKSVDARAGNSIVEVATLANRVRRWPTVIMTYYPGNDEIAHRFGSDSPEYASSLLNIDAVVGHVCAAMDRAGLSESTTFVLCSDHGHVPSDDSQRFAVEDWLARHRGRRVINRDIRSLDFEQRYRLLEPYDTVVINGAYRRCAVHFRGPLGWADPPSTEQIRDLIASDPPLHHEPAIELILTSAGPHRAQITSRDGSAVIERRVDGAQKYYRVLTLDGDPLHLREDANLAAFVEAGWHSSRDWLCATAMTRYPDLVPQTIEMFDSPRAGDVVIHAAGHWTFGDEARGGHGSCLWRDQRIPLFFAGPGLPQGASILCGRLVDIMPTLIDLLGAADRLATIPPIDGVSLRRELETAGMPDAHRLVARPSW